MARSDEQVPVRPHAGDQVPMRPPRSRLLQHHLSEDNEARLAALRKSSRRSPEEEAELADLQSKDGIPPVLTPDGRRRLDELKARENVKLTDEDAALLHRLETAGRDPEQERQYVALQARGPLTADEKKEMGMLQAVHERRSKYDQDRVNAEDKEAAGPFTVEQWRWLRGHLADLHDAAIRERARRSAI